MGAKFFVPFASTSRSTKLSEQEDMPRSVATTVMKGLTEPPPVPVDLNLGKDYKAKKCKRCGIWSTERCQYDQSEAAESAWGILVAWESGNLKSPQGNHCYICRKVGKLQAIKRKRHIQFRH